MIILVVILFIVGAFIWLSFTVFPAISGYGSKNLCSAIYLQHRNAADVINEDLSKFPLSLGSFTVNENDASVTGSVWGMAKRKTIYRKGIGCTMVNDFSEADIRKQKFLLPSPTKTNSEAIPWPYGDKVVETTSTKINKALLQSAVDNIMQATTLDGYSAYTRATIIVYDGNIIAEEYAPGFDKNTVMLGWSVSKSLTAAMIGILVKENKLS
ncbi:MAG: hypothetical protein ABI266_05355, partial [Ginsengibacter sp.]